MSSDFNYNFGFVVEEIFKLEHVFDVSTLRKIFTLIEFISSREE